ncbi:uncharacterized protein LOC113350899 [Papaver somniferum]|uniref:uncharacterized protein LOC113350899 n=1 Tax=Papaver somniferum TaxID=3469 RepID=UPI000E6FE9DF|nr:uncharacterized protein LOC113350899 [Papaver somniferum]
MSELDITCASPRAIKGQAVADLQAVFPGEGTTSLREDLLGEFPDISVVEEEAWLLYFDGFSTPSNNTRGAGIVLVSQTVRRFRRNLDGEEENGRINVDFIMQRNWNLRWRTPIIQELSSSLSQGKDSLKTLQSFFMLHGMLYHRNPDDSLSRCLGDEEAQLQLNRVHDEICGQTLVVTLYRRLRRLGYYWPEMETQSHLLQKSCSNCQMSPHQLEVFSVSHAGDWREPYIRYLHDGVTPANQKDSINMKQKAKKFVFHEGILWGLDIIGKINPPLSKKHKYIITATEYVTKWVESIPLRGTTGATIAAFIKEYIICRFGVPKHIITDNDTPFGNKQVRELLKGYKIKQVFSTIYYPQGNGQAESTNKTLIRVLIRTVHDNPREWNEKQPMALWVYRTTPRNSIVVSPYLLVYGADAILPAEIKIPSARIAAASGVHWNEAEALISRIAELDTLDSRRGKAEERAQMYRNMISRAYDKTIRPRVLKKMRFGLKETAKHIQQDMPAPKFSPKWEGPYVITKAYSTGYYKIVKVDGGKLEAVINGKWLKAYHA